MHYCISKVAKCFPKKTFTERISNLRGKQYTVSDGSNLGREQTLNKHGGLGNFTKIETNIISSLRIRLRKYGE